MSADDMLSVRAIADLMRSRPPFGAAPLELAEYFDKKADCFEAIARHGGVGAEEAQRLAEKARIDAAAARAKADAP